MEGCDALEGYSGPPALTFSYMNHDLIWLPSEFSSLVFDQTRKWKKQTNKKVEIKTEMHDDQEGQEVINQQLLEKKSLIRDSFPPPSPPPSLFQSSWET